MDALLDLLFYGLMVLVFMVMQGLRKRRGGDEAPQAQDSQTVTQPVTQPLPLRHAAHHAQARQAAGAMDTAQGAEVAETAEAIEPERPPRRARAAEEIHPPAAGRTAPPPPPPRRDPGFPDPMAARHAAHALHTRRGLQQAVVAMAVLGPCRARAPHDEAN